MQNAVVETSNREDRPAYARFERVAVEDKQATLRNGAYVAKDVDFVLLTPSYSKDVFKQKIPAWFLQLDQDLRDGRIPKQWVDNYKAAYEAWKNGQELPLNGTPIRGWGVISPAQQETLIRMHCLTVEDLAKINDEGIRRVGMGAIDLKNKAKAWLAQLQDKGPLTVEMAALKQENDSLKTTVDTLTGKLEELTNMVKANIQGVTTLSVSRGTQNVSIEASDILDDPAPRTLSLPKKK